MLSQLCVHAGSRLCTVLNKIMGWTGWDVELSQPNRDASTAHMCRLWDAAASSLSKALLQHSQSDRLNAPRMLLLLMLLL